MEKAEQEQWKKELVSCYYKTKKEVLAFPKKDRDAVVKLMNNYNEQRVRNPLKASKKISVWDARNREKEGKADLKDKQLLKKCRSKIKKFNKLFDAYMN